MSRISITSISLPANTVKTTDIIDGSVTRAKLAQDTSQVYSIPLERFRVWDAMQTNLPGTSSADDLALVGGTFGTNAPSLQTSDLKNAGSTTLYARAMIVLPMEYVSGGDVKIRLTGGAVTTVASVAMTCDVVAYKSSKNRTIGSDLCTTAAQSINSTTFAAKDFVLTATDIDPGDVLDVRIAVLVNDSGTGTAVIGCIGGVDLICTAQG